MAKDAGDTPITDQPFYWFCCLEKAVDRGDYARAAKAQAELSRLGVKVTYTPHRRSYRPAREVAHA